jgi:hypothetical protein
MPIERVIPLHEVVKILEKGIQTSFDCVIGYYVNGVIIFTFAYKRDPVLQLRVQNGAYDIIDYPRITNDTLEEIAHAFKNAVACMTALQVPAKR